MGGRFLPRLPDTSRAIDIRTIDRHPLASVGSLVLGLRCSWCPASAPTPRITGLDALPPAVRHTTTPGHWPSLAGTPRVMVRLQTEKLVPQPQAAVAFGFLILNDVLIRSLT
jgi:hypothetical protein